MLLTNYSDAVLILKKLGPLGKFKWKISLAKLGSVFLKTAFSVTAIKFDHYEVCKNI